MCDPSDGVLQCGDKPAGFCCIAGATRFILSTNTQLTSAPGGGTTTHILYAAQGNPPNYCAIVLNTDTACARTSASGTAQSGSYSWRSFGRRSEAIEATASTDCSLADTFYISDGDQTYVAPTFDNSTIDHILSLGRAERIVWAKENGKAV
ncbi:hypothetical protein CONLIGDRAFT_635707 [Coniochaeta ligniaria NRRL 30616]|uniref:Uncharacterized protein n=1 Tax=Coniochaeta ligniaria NRRL 30616 TaxID=1408157 RepID=A0A1J7IXY5_9PEZI|nr:hypothetical protein CONLIGDRAFT_635707 [Coniochaeta ligniaria NRRL 30616]